ncbi:MAG: DUF3987 domain-containing protein, partial [Terriglobia bacterium]
MRLDRWGLLGDTATLLTGKSEISPIAVAFSLLALTGAELSDRVVESGRIDRSQLNLFILLVGQSGITRKSSAMSRAGSFWREMLETSTRVHEGAGSGEGLARLLGGGTKLLPARGCLLYDESIQFMSKAAIDGSSLLSVFNSLYDGRSWENQIKRSEHSSRIDNGVLSFIGAATPEIYQSLWSETGVGIGLLNRFLLIELQPPAERYFFPIFPSNDEKLTVAQRWHDRLADPAHCISWPSQASAQCQAWYTSLAPRAEITRIDELLRRLVFLNCWFRNITEVD